ncbi:MAG TPA: DUF5819 family protein [Flavobacteriales bacterium]|nr:DUF5819 family protein [Flavobacteriales bacterium]
MASKLARLTVALVVAGQLSLVLAFTLPRNWVPARLVILSGHVMRPLFEQHWNLFAPDPWTCDRRIEVGLPDGSWRPVAGKERHFLLRRAARPLAELVANDLERGERMVRKELAAAMRGLVRDIGREVPELRFRLVERCVVDAAEPTQRTETIKLLQLPAP